MATNAARYAANAAMRYAASDRLLSDFAERIVQILIDMGTPGCAYLDLVPVADA